MSLENRSLLNRHNFQCIVSTLGIISLAQIVQEKTYKQIFQDIVICDLKVSADPAIKISNMHTKSRGYKFID